MGELTAEAIIETLGLRAHPEGGWYAETFRDPSSVDGRAHSTVIFFLLKAGERSHWHRVDAAETWFFHAGAPLILSISDDGRATRTLRLGADLLAGERPHGVVPKDAWQAASTTGAWTLVSCTVAPGFRFDGFELAPPGWAPSETGH